MNVSRETSQRLEAYLALLQKWSPKINLVSERTLLTAWNRHVEDSLQLLTMRPSSTGPWVDLGTGGGLPGLIVAIAAQDQNVAFTLVEADHRKAAFLRRAVGLLKLDRTTVLCDRIESVPPLGAMTVSARALAPLPTLMAYVARHLAPGGAALLPKGRRWRDEVDDARATWTFDCVPHPSLTDPEAAILEVSAIHAR